MSLISNFIKKESEERTLPVFVLLDASASMTGEKIETVNVALKEMINSFKKITDAKGVIELCLISFSKDSVNIIKPLSKIKDEDVYNLIAEGRTPMGAALEKVIEMIEDTSVVSNRSYTPTIVMLSDGWPTDISGYDPKANMSKEDILNLDIFKKFHSSDRISKSVKLAMGVGDCDNNVMKAFINNETIPVVKSNDTRTISQFFNWVTMSVSTRSISANPNQVKIGDAEDYFDKDDIEF